MPSHFGIWFRKTRTGLRRAVLGPQALAFLPATILAAFWIGGEIWLIALAIAMPALYSLTGSFRPARPGEDPHPRDSTTGLPLRRTLETALNDRLDMAASLGRTTACFLISIDDFAELVDRYGHGAGEDILARTADRLCAAVRDGDLVCRTGEEGFGIALGSVAYLDLESAIQLAGRLQSAVEEPVALGATGVYVSASIGFCLAARAPEQTGHGVLHAADIALDEARRNGPSAIRAFTAEMSRQVANVTLPIAEITHALETGQMRPFFQPQLSTDTGRVSGFEALARWCHPERGVIPPAEFLPAVEKIGAMERLGELILTRSLDAVTEWDRARLTIPQVGVNFSAAELHDPKLIERIRWQLDRFDLGAERLVIEVLENVVAGSPDDVISRNINGLSELGCAIDLDDFGTGHASISSIRRFAVSRIKIDRSFVKDVHLYSELAKITSAMIGLAHSLRIDALAEGVETPEERLVLNALGCDHIQGFGVSQPMPGSEIESWIKRTQNTRTLPPRRKNRRIA